MNRATRLPVFLVGLVGLVGLAACSTYRPPFTLPEGASAPTDPHQASLVFLWPPTSCDPAGYFTLATTDGHFLGTISRGSRLSVLVPAGERTVVAWNDVEEQASGWVPKASVPVLHADLREGRTYYVRMVIGDWDETGPALRRLYTRRFATPLCSAVPGDGVTSAMVTVSPEQAEWRDVPEWMATLAPIVADDVTGQAWLDGHRDSLAAHVAVGEGRYAGLRLLAKRQATIEPGDGAPR